MKKRAQQEIAGFVIIVVLVVVAAFIFMVLSFGNKKAKNDSAEVSGLLNALLEQTTACVVNEPVPLNVGELIKEAYAGSLECKGIGYSTRDYLNKTLHELMGNVMRIENRFKAWQIDIYPEGEEGYPIGRFYQGYCGDGQMVSFDRVVRSFRVELKICLNSYD